MKTFLFDFDGTLVDSMPTFVNTMIKILEQNNISYPDDLVKIITPLGYVGTAKYFRTLGISLSINEQLTLMHEYAKTEYTYNILAKENVEKALIYLKQKGYSLNVLTASPHDMLDPCLKRLGLYDLFDNVWSSEDFNLTKADVEIYKQASTKLGVKTQDVIFLDDNYFSLKTAKQSGMKVYGVFDQTSQEFAGQIKEIVDKYIVDFEELTNE
jgi:HAD superfamily hydrolase (TIGR01509 family)